MPFGTCRTAGFGLVRINFYKHTNMKFLQVLFLILPFPLFGQGPIAQEISQLLQTGEIDKAEKRVEYYLKKNPKEVDAIMMKGNVTFSQECCPDHVVLETNTDESIYNNSIGFMGQGGPTVVPVELGTRIADLWKLAVSYDLSRTDIHFGICQIYSTSMMVDELIEYLPTLKKNVQNNDKLHYSMSDYARNLKDRGDFESAMQVYNYIAKLYPNEHGLYSDIAAEYFLHGDMELAKESIGKALEDDQLDEMSLGNAFFFYSVMGEFDRALECLKRQSKLTNVDDYLFYQSLLSFSRGEEWKTSMENFLKITKDKNWKTAATIMVSDEFVIDLDSYLKLTEMELIDGVKILIHQAYKNKTPNKFEPFFNYAELLTYNQLFEDAIVEFEKIENSNLINDQEDLENLSFYYAWSLWKVDQRQLSIEKWQKLENSENFLYKSASAYFQGKHFYDLGDMTKAKEYFGRVQEEASKSKYATMSWNYFNRLN
jgi:tetratricopeptide (TPR) repeat protein